MKTNIRPLTADLRSLLSVLCILSSAICSNGANLTDIILSPNPGAHTMREWAGIINSNDDALDQDIVAASNTLASAITEATPEDYETVSSNATAAIAAVESNAVNPNMLLDMIYTNAADRDQMSDLPDELVYDYVVDQYPIDYIVTDTGNVYTNGANLHATVSNATNGTPTDPEFILVDAGVFACIDSGYELPLNSHTILMSRKAYNEGLDQVVTFKPDEYKSALTGFKSLESESEGLPSIISGISGGETIPPTEILAHLTGGAVSSSWVHGFVFSYGDIQLEKAAEDMTMSERTVISDCAFTGSSSFDPSADSNFIMINCVSEINSPGWSIGTTMVSFAGVLSGCTFTNINNPTLKIVGGDGADEILYLENSTFVSDSDCWLKPYGTSGTFYIKNCSFDPCDSIFRGASDVPLYLSCEGTTFLNSGSDWFPNSQLFVAGSHFTDCEGLATNAIGYPNLSLTNCTDYLGNPIADQ